LSRRLSGWPIWPAAPRTVTLVIVALIWVNGLCSMCQESVNVDITGEYDGIEAISKSYGSDECGCVLKIRPKVLPKGRRDV
jgi:hypothetical protein